MLTREKAIAKQHAAGKYTARERIGLLLDPGSFHEIGQSSEQVRCQEKEFSLDPGSLHEAGPSTGRPCADSGEGSKMDSVAVPGMVSKMDPDAVPGMVSKMVPDAVPGMVSKMVPDAGAGTEEKEIPVDGVVTGWGLVDGRRVFVYAQDFTDRGGSIGRAQAGKICRILDLAGEAGAPVVGINDSGGARIQEGADALAGIGEILSRIAGNSGKIPQISMIMGPCAGGAAYAPAMTDLVVMRKGQGLMFCTGPGVIREVTGEAVDAQALGGAGMHAERSGEADLVADTEEEAFSLVRRFLGYLPSSSMEKPPRAGNDGRGLCYKNDAGNCGKEVKAFPGSIGNPALRSTLEDGDFQDRKGVSELRPALAEIVPDDGRKPYDMLEVIGQIADEGSFLELQPLFADNLVIGLARIAGRPVGVVANQPYVMAGCLDLDAADKGARFVGLCDAFGIPLVSLVDVPGFLPGVEQEQRGLLRHGARLLRAFATAKVPKMTVILRKAYGGAYMAMCSREMGADRVFAWPGAEIAVMGAAGAVNVLYSREIAKAEDPEAKRAELLAKYEDPCSTPSFAAGRGYVDEIIRPCLTREKIVEALELLGDKN